MRGKTKSLLGRQRRTRDQVTGYQAEEEVDEALKSKWMDSYLVHPVPVGAELF